MISSSASSASSASTAPLNLYECITADHNTHIRAADAAYASHKMAAAQLHQAQMQLLTAVEDVDHLTAKLERAKAAATAAVVLVNRKRKAAADAELEFDAIVRSTQRRCWGAFAPMPSKFSACGAGDTDDNADAVADAMDSGCPPKFADMARAAARMRCDSPHYDAVSPVAAGTDHMILDTRRDATPTFDAMAPSTSPDSPTFGPSPVCRKPCAIPHYDYDDDLSPVPTPCDSPRATTPAYAPTAGDYHEVSAPTSASFSPHLPAPAAAARRGTLKWGK